MINKIHIIGSVGSGKTTLAKELAAKLNLPHIELDNVSWERRTSGDRRRTEEECAALLHTLVQSDQWIIEGVHTKEWVDTSFRNADLIIFLDTANHARLFRIMRRYLLQKLRIESSNYKPTKEILFNMFKWNKHFEDVAKPEFFKKYAPLQDKILIVKNKRSVDEYKQSLSPNRLGFI
ncbi:AAA family ATPase [Alkalihalophilus pseudofirmus]|uniref:AAA family ATPase n=1 Tax=Alkalihalophilus pseudofirmus TaxID=79885 RepID=A0AAJ2KVR7_ALKPS|nr:AAA family ATPase [Alkalihalophilus pseudofirmus]MDV2884768.1 AAA family ATPase [Alkalihalophilus pseudofirmus]